MNIENLRVDGVLTMTLHRANGENITFCKHNMIVNGGYDLICNALGDSSRPGVLSHIALGTGTTSVAATQTALVAEISRLAATYAHTANTKVFTMSATFGAGVATGAITEAGVFNAASGGTMFDRITFAVINKGDDDTITTQFTFTLS
mgnify:CR=1 FL=1